MPVSTYNYNSSFKPAFKAKNRDTKKADDVMRSSKLEFAAFQPNYAFYYNCAKPESTHYKEAGKNLTHLCMKLRRDVRDWDNNLDKPKRLLDNVKTYKIAHCYERTLAAMAILYREGYNELLPVGVHYETNAINRKTGKTEFTAAEPLDHSVILTNMNNNKRFDIEDLIIIDPWLEYAGSVSDARARYKAAFSNRIKTAQKKNSKKCEQYINNPEKYRISEKIEFHTLDLDKREIGELKNYFKAP